MSKRPKKIKLDLPEPIAELIALGFSVAAAGAGNTTLFVNPTPTPAVILAATQALQTAHTSAKQRVPGAATARVPKENTLRSLLGQWGAYLEGIAATMPGQEAYVYQQGGFRQRATPHRVNSQLKLSQPKGAGTPVHARCQAALRGKRAAYGWRISLDGGKTWIVSQTNKSKTTFVNIPAGTLIEVQYNTTVDDITSTWSSSATLLVS